MYNRNILLDPGLNSGSVDEEMALGPEFIRVYFNHYFEGVNSKRMKDKLSRTKDSRKTND